MFSSPTYLLLSLLSLNLLTPEAHSLPHRPPQESAPLDFVDLSPHITGNRTFYLKSPYTRSMEAKIYNSNGEVAYSLNPVSTSETSSIHLQKANTTAECQVIKLVSWVRVVTHLKISCLPLLTQGTISANQSNCPSQKFPTFFHSSKSGEWTVESDTEKHSTYDPLFTRKFDEGPVGPIYDSSAGNITLAEISVIRAPGLALHKPPKHVPHGEYYSVHIPADRGHDPFISPTAANNTSYVSQSLLLSLSLSPQFETRTHTISRDKTTFLSCATLYLSLINIKNYPGVTHFEPISSRLHGEVVHELKVYASAPLFQMKPTTTSPDTPDKIEIADEARRKGAESPV
ncbi:uncharacterized protein MELLADRAFT_67245 [Melampsora larici-populina 98AG31]|uniref:Secreted protein n=1 Tax=Melampsora larici-populina (strain 98AG31 / pathotype 3-4-7) TaxID=747676 RepID=F4S2C3_MELLP|nr:uncharacterized protein MELLADRAFT_67245 [Melampsora larici-populina 98AG31]EGG01148.1 hypothetical protein MELLADRAFT_67245 [Melampsora larici-populina 98AG31]